MSTRSITVFLDNSKRPFFAMYRMMDGYPEGHGMALRRFFRKFGCFNGVFSVKAKPNKSANGIEDLAAQTVAYFKRGLGNIYIEHPDAKMDEEYRYIVYLEDDEIYLKVIHIEWDWTPDTIPVEKVLYDGPANIFYLKKEFANV